MGKIGVHGRLDILFLCSIDHVNAVIDLLQRMNDVCIHISPHITGKGIFRSAVGLMRSLPVGVQNSFRNHSRIIEQLLGKALSECFLCRYHIVYKGSKYRRIDQEFQQSGSFAWNPVQPVQILRIDQQDLINDLTVVMRRHDSYGCGISCRENACLFPYDIFNKIDNGLYIEIAGVGDIRFVGQSISKHIYCKHFMCFCQLIKDFVELIAAASFREVVKEEQRTAVSFLCISDLSKTPFIIFIVRTGKRVVYCAERKFDSVDDMHGERCKSG